MSDRFKDGWEIEFRKIRSRINPWDRANLPPHPEAINEKTVAEYLKAVKPLIERGRWWALISPVAEPLFGVLQAACLIGYYAYLFLWVPAVVFAMVFDDAQAGVKLQNAILMVILGSPMFFLWRWVKNVRL